MAIKSKEYNWDDPQPQFDASVPSFDVTVEQVIGTVSIVSDGKHTPREAAFLLIAQHGADGTYRFPSEDGGQVTVNVDTTLPAEVPA